MRRLRTSIRLKLTVATLVPLVTAIAVCWLVGSSIIVTRFSSQAQQTVEADLNSARELLLGEQARLSDIIRLTGQMPELSATLLAAGPASAVPPLQVLLGNERLSFLTLVDRHGFVRYRAATGGLGGDNRKGDKLVAAALKGAVSSGVSLLSARQAAMENPQLPQLMTIPIKATPHGQPFPKKIEDRGLFLVASAPVLSADGALLGAVYGGVLLNNDNRLVDRITRVIFPAGDRGNGSRGSATIFLDDVRIATSVLDEQGKAAIGTLMSEEVFATVSRGGRWKGSAFVLRDKYFTNYEPLLDLQGAPVGALFVGMPEQPLLQLRSQVNIIFSAVLLFVTLIGMALSAWLGSSMSRPLRALVVGVRRIAAGGNLPDISVDSHDEIAELADEFNTMKHRLAAREEENRVLNRTLEQRVVERTAQLEEKNQLLLTTQKELAEAERLAGIGLLASGVAHEINNPLAIIRGNAELLEMFAGPDAPRSEELTTIIEQAVRIEGIVRNLLTFSRSGTKRLTLFPLAALLDDILDQIGHQIALDAYTISRKYQGRDITLEGDEGQLQQVFTNLIVNGLQAMAGGGILTVDAAASADSSQVSVTVADNGPGITPELREQIFTPFFSTKRNGTGLGLAVSYGIVKDHGGEIRISGEEGSGAVFTVVLPLRQGALPLPQDGASHA